jgi:hypothetical protein
MEEADGILFEPLLGSFGAFDFWQARYAMPLQAPMQ